MADNVKRSLSLAKEFIRAEGGFVGTGEDLHRQAEGLPLFSPENLIHTYSRAEAIADGELVDASDMAREAGFSFPVALTAALHADIAAVPEDQPWQSYDGRLWDCLWMLKMAITGRIPSEGDDQCRVYALIMHVERAATYRVKEMYQVKATCGPGDDGEPVLTLMKPAES